MTSKSHLIAIFDLDGTLIPGNSFHKWLKTIILMGIDSMISIEGTRLWFCTLRSMIFRILKINNHANMKYQVQKAWNQFKLNTRTDPELLSFANKLLTEVRPELLSTIQAFRKSGIKTILATAAPADYAESFGKKNRGGFSACDKP